MNFYARVMRSIVQRGVIHETDTVLVVAGGKYDVATMVETGLQNVTISNLSYHDGHSDYTPYEWRRLDAERLELEDESYDWVVVHAGLHHLAVPAQGVSEMFRVARKGIVCFEARDSMLMKLAILCGLTSEYELEPAFLTDGAVGGHRDGPLPNYVYRWTEREFEKVVNSYAPAYQHKFFYHYGFAVPTQRFAMARRGLLRLLGRIIIGLTTVAEWVIPSQGNQFAMVALKNSRLQPWLTPELTFNQEYLAKKYDKAKYRRR